MDLGSVCGQRNQSSRSRYCMKFGAFRQIPTLGRVSNLPSVWTNCLAAWMVNASVSDALLLMPEKSDFFFPPDNVLLYLLVGASFCYMGGCTLNDAMDKDFDDQHNPNRPIPSAKISLSQAWLLGLIQLGLGGVLLIIGAECSPLWIALLLLSILSYDWIHKKWAGGVFIMGGCRLFLWLGAATVGMETDIAPQTWGWGLALYGYVVGISLYAKNESINKEEPHRVAIFLLFLPSLCALGGLVLWNNLDPIRVFLVNVSGLLVGWIVFDSILSMRGEEKGAIGKGVSRLLAGICGVDAITLAFVCPILVGPVTFGIFLSHLAQKKFAAT